MVVFDRLGPNKCDCKNPFVTRGMQRGMSRVCVSVVNGMNWGWESQLGTEGLALDPWLGASAPTSWLDIDDKLFQLQLAKNLMLHSA